MRSDFRFIFWLNFRCSEKKKHALRAQKKRKQRIGNHTVDRDELLLTQNRGREKVQLTRFRFRESPKLLFSVIFTEFSLTNYLFLSVMNPYKLLKLYEKVYLLPSDLLVWFSMNNITVYDIDFLMYKWLSQMINLLYGRSFAGSEQKLWSIAAQITSTFDIKASPCFCLPAQMQEYLHHMNRNKPDPPNFEYILA